MKCRIMPHNAAFHQGLHCLKSKKKKKKKKKKKNTPLDIYNGPSQVISSNQMDESISIQRVNKLIKV